jgi:hypothetical protein
VKPRGVEWEHRKAAYYARHRKACRACGTRAAIHLHHVRYGRPIGSEPDADLVPLCNAHHSAVHQLHESGALELAEATRLVIEAVSGRPFRGGGRRKRTRKRRPHQAARYGSTKKPPANLSPYGEDGRG